MSESVKTVIRERVGTMNPGDVYVLNAPYNGGTHLPDVTVITPVFGENETEAGRPILFYVGARGHHADIGEATPGSMPPDSTSVEQEGVLLDNVLRPILMARGLQTPMAVILAGVICGTISGGLIGLFVGPVVLAVFYDLVMSWMGPPPEAGAVTSSSAG